MNKLNLILTFAAIFIVAVLAVRFHNSGSEAMSSYVTGEAIISKLTCSQIATSAGYNSEQFYCTPDKSCKTGYVSLGINSDCNSCCALTTASNSFAATCASKGGVCSSTCPKKNWLGVCYYKVIAKCSLTSSCWIRK